MNDRFKFQFDIYQRRFKQPLRTSHGLWQIREGIIISLKDKNNHISYGEIAPLPWFGSETMSQAVEFCQQWGDIITLQNIKEISDRLPCCQFALESALLDLKSINIQESGYAGAYLTDLDQYLSYCYLLPAGEKVLTAWRKIYQAQANHTFKWKIGVYPLEQEIEILKELVRVLPPQVKLRLDANGGLDLNQAKKLLTTADKLKKIDFIEQLLAPDKFVQMLQLSREYTTPLALDESVASFNQLQSVYQQGWQGVFVIKAAIMGFPSRLVEYCQANSLDVVFSSVFETEVGKSAVLKIAQQLNHPRAVGFGVNYFSSY